MTQNEKGGRDAAFFLFLFFVAVLGFGGSLQYPLAVLRAGAFGAAILFLWRRRKEPVPLGIYSLLVGGFVVLSFGHSASSVYFWVSFQHALNIALAALLLVWAVRLFRRSPAGTWNATLAAVVLLASVEVGIALFQRFHGGEIRPRGTFDNANYLSEFLVAAALLCFSRLLWSVDSRRMRCAAAPAGVLFLSAAFALPSSRGVLVASVPAFGVLLVSRFGYRKGAALLAGVGIPTLLLVGWRVTERFFWPDIYNYSRWIIWKSALRTFLDHPFGVGLGGFKYYWFATQSPVEGAFRRFGKFADTAHNEYLEILSGLGGVGFLLFLAVLTYPVYLVLKKRKEIPVDRISMAAGSASCLVLSGCHALSNANFHVFGIFFLNAVMLGAILSCIPEDLSPIVHVPYWLHRAGMAVFAVLFAAGVSTVLGVFAYDRGVTLLRAGDLAGAERAFRIAVAVDPFRATYPDALSAVHYRYYMSGISTGEGYRGRVPESFSAALRWENRARKVNPRELKYTLRLSGLFLELFRLRGRPSDAGMSYRLAGSALRINPCSIEAMGRKAKVLGLMGRREEAAKELETAITVEPNFCTGYATLADLARTVDSTEAARWSAKAEECRGRATALALEDYEKWLVE